MRTGFYYKATGEVHGVEPKFFGNPRPPGSRNDGSPPETSSLETLPSSGESPANLNTSIRVDPGRPILAPKKRLVSIPAQWGQGWQGAALAARNPVTQR